LNLSVAVTSIWVSAILADFSAAGADSFTNSPPPLRITCEHSSGVYRVNEPIRWRAELINGFTNTDDLKYSVRRGGMTVLEEGSLKLTNGAAEITTKLSEPDTVLVEVKVPTPKEAKKKARIYGGAVVEPERIKPSEPCPQDFDKFWNAKIKELGKIPANPVLTEQPSEMKAVNYWQITMDNIRGTHVRGQVARPIEGKKFPAILIVQGAGVYALGKGNVTGSAKKGWLALNLNAHDLALDETPEFYQKQMAGPLTNYWFMGNEDRETSYFLRMYLSCYRAVDYLTHRPDWDGKTMLVFGISQGGLQALITAGLHPKVTAAIAGVPGGCDLTAAELGRSPGWPAHYKIRDGKDTKRFYEASRYYDVVNFAPRIKCPVLVSAGLIDEVCPPVGIIAAFNQIKSPKELVILPQADHMGTGDTHRGFSERYKEWQKALLEGRFKEVASALP